MRTVGFGLRTTPTFSDGHQPTTSLNTSDITKRQQKPLANYCLAIGWQVLAALLCSDGDPRDVAWRATIDAGWLVPRASRVGISTLGAPSCCVEVENFLLGELLDEQPTWRLSTPRSN